MITTQILENIEDEDGNYNLLPGALRFMDNEYRLIMNPDEIVINKNNTTLIIDYPIIGPHYKKNISSNTNNFTVLQLWNEFYNTYIKLYNNNEYELWRDIDDFVVHDFIYDSINNNIYISTSS